MTGNKCRYIKLCHIDTSKTNAVDFDPSKTNVDPPKYKNNNITGFVIFLMMALLFVILIHHNFDPSK